MNQTRGEVFLQVREIDVGWMRGTVGLLPKVITWATSVRFGHYIVSKLVTRETRPIIVYTFLPMVKLEISLLS